MLVSRSPFWTIGSIKAGRSEGVGANPEAKAKQELLGLGQKKKMVIFKK
ncbi:MAG: hypothetical protein LBR11_07330 [Deltaproteobacteria bacterium]|jgi:hypothetical protein|nr:hypothetical protein [Deltaproteobacteria bacterium]